jgi:hypothetical protein
MLNKAQKEEHRGRLIARVVRTLLATEHFDSLADLTDALKFRLARLRIAWTHDDINSAYSMITSNTPLLGVRELPVLPSHLRSQNEKPDHAISRAEAAAILNRLGIEL